MDPLSCLYFFNTKLANCIILIHFKKVLFGVVLQLKTSLYLFIVRHASSRCRSIIYISFVTSPENSRLKMSDYVKHGVIWYFTLQHWALRWHKHYPVFSSFIVTKSLPCWLVTQLTIINYWEFGLDVFVWCSAIIHIQTANTFVHLQNSNKF